MNPRQITEVKILPMIEREPRGNGVELVAEINGVVVMSLPMHKMEWLPVGILFDNYFNWADGDYNTLMTMIMKEMVRMCKMMNISTLISPQHSGSAPVKAFENLGFINAFSSGGWDLSNDGGVERGLRQIFGKAPKSRLPLFYAVLPHSQGR
jgi:hypothetical protein